MNKLSLALATYNEESNILACINSCKNLVDEVVVVDGSSTDKTGEIALHAGARVIRTQNEAMFHINKQKAIDACTGEWILQLDADERVTPELAEEIKKVMGMTNEEIHKYQDNLKEKELFLRHQKLTQQSVISTAVSGNERSGEITKSEISPRASLGRDDTYSAFFIPRLNYFLGGYLRSGGVYPDGVIRLIRKGKAFLPCKDVHELMTVEGQTGWLVNSLIHMDSPTFKRYLERNSRYIDHLVEELLCNTHHVTRNIQNNLFKMLYVSCYMLYLGMDWVIVKPFTTFFLLLIRHKGILDGWRGVVWAFFSSIRFARAYFRFTRAL